MKNIFVFLAEGFEEIEALTPVDVLRRAGLSVQTVSVMDEQIVAGAHGVPVLADKMFAEINPEDAEMILLPGGLPGATNLDAHEGLGQMIQDFAKEEKPLAAICAAPLVFGNRGLLSTLFLQYCYTLAEDDRTVCVSYVVVNARGEQVLDSSLKVLCVDILSRASATVARGVIGATVEAAASLAASTRLRAATHRLTATLAEH